jgi:hypothetical protein
MDDAGIARLLGGKRNIFSIKRSGELHGKGPLKAIFRFVNF